MTSEGDGRVCVGSGSGDASDVTVLIDNYDSFTYNVVQYLVELGANLVVFRNDKVTVEQIAAMNPVNIVISPGPGHPLKDAGVSLDVIRYFSGKVPILGICMGLQAIVAVDGGIIEYAGEIVHGKVTDITHDGQGLYRGLPEKVVGMRYHSLAARRDAMPSTLKITSETANGIVMGARHKTYTVEGVQYHPESVISGHGREIMRNFLSWRGGTWAENPDAGVAAPTETILERIYAQRKIDVERARALPGQSLADLERAIALHADPPQVSFPARILQAKGTAVMAELKRASPSKGDIDPHAHAGVQALTYARGGASVISVLTEPHWFRGSIGDLALARQSVAHLADRPAILRKDFIVDVYQIAEARLAGADTVLLIVAMLSDSDLRTLYDYAVSLGMDPLVEVNTAEEMQRALALEPRVIGINNRNLHTFNVDMATTSNLAKAAIEQGVLLAALSGIQGRADVERYVADGVHAVLVGEALMRAQDKHAFISELSGVSPQAPPALPPLAKVCGLRSASAAVTAAQAGAHLLGIILAPGTKRTVSLDTAREIIDAVRALPPRARTSADEPAQAPQGEWFAHHAYALTRAAQERPLIVGVFRDQPLDEVVATASALRLDVVQLHGHTEAVEWARYLPGVFVVRVFSIDPAAGAFEFGERRALDQATRPGCHHVIAFDTGSPQSSGGGTGVSFDWGVARAVAAHDAAGAHDVRPFMLGGGLTPENVREARQRASAWIVDTSSGVETDGTKDPAKITAFVAEALK
ncbi:anthranilate synthase / indole-3-glycerol phosphate synthase [Malassezia cuniculi]|uniref:Multifunctional tryptophan biosynthesis protein n=1 Tax=Malassezia cuniculi TaxID=948313 RepID=A0AAF0JA07_9BASI|nr:anthranilate synthase / indole-3-glycerol phosphate synthase [Malassezia cuniculi]